MELGQVVKDFLPPPDQLIPKIKTKTNKVTLELPEESVEPDKHGGKPCIRRM